MCAPVMCFGHVGWAHAGDGTWRYSCCAMQFLASLLPSMQHYNGSVLCTGQSGWWLLKFSSMSGHTTAALGLGVPWSRKVPPYLRLCPIASVHLFSQKLGAEIKVGRPMFLTTHSQRMQGLVLGRVVPSNLYNVLVTNRVPCAGMWSEEKGIR